MSFVHLHSHSQYSMLDSTIRIRDLVSRATEDGVGAIAMTDHNNMFGAVAFYKAATRAGIKPILGAEVDLVTEDRTDPNIRRTCTIVLLCKNNDGYRNLCYLLSRAYMDAPPRARGPRIDRGLLAEYADGLIALSGGLSGEIPQALLRGQQEEAEAIARHYCEVFGPSGFYLEIIRNGIKEQDEVNAALVSLSETLDVPLVAAADAHYNTEEEAAAHEVLMCIQMGKSLPSLETRARITDSLTLASASDICELYLSSKACINADLRLILNLYTNKKDMQYF